MQQCGGGEGEEGVEAGRGGVQKSFRAPGRGCKRGNEVQDEARGRNGGKWGGGQIHSDTEEVKKKDLAGRPKKKHGHTVGGWGGGYWRQLKATLSVSIKIKDLNITCWLLNV